MISNTVKKTKKEVKRSKNNTPKLKYNVLENETVRQDQKLQNKIFSPKINRLDSTWCGGLKMTKRLQKSHSWWNKNYALKLRIY